MEFIMTDAHSFNSQMRLEGRIFTNYVNRSVVVQIFSGHEVKYRERIINSLRTRELGWVYESTKRNKKECGQATVTKVLTFPLSK